MFNGCVFWFGRSISALDRVQLTKLIKRSGGKISVFHSSATHCLASIWELNFSSNSPLLHFSFVEECIEQECLLPISSYLLSPTSSISPDTQVNPTSDTFDMNLLFDEWDDPVPKSSQIGNDKLTDEEKKLHEKSQAKRDAILQLQEQKKEKKQQIRQQRLENARQSQQAARIRKEQNPRKLSKDKQSNSIVEPNRSFVQVLLTFPPPKIQAEGRKLFVGKIKFGDLASKRNSTYLNERRQQLLIDVFKSFGVIEEVIPFWEKQHCFIVYQSTADAEKAVCTLSVYENRVKALKTVCGNQKHLPECCPKPNFYVRWPNGVNKSRTLF